MTFKLGFLLALATTFLSSNVLAQQFSGRFTGPLSLYYLQSDPVGFPAPSVLFVSFVARDNGRAVIIRDLMSGQTLRLKKSGKNIVSTKIVSDLMLPSGVTCQEQLLIAMKRAGAKMGVYKSSLGICDTGAYWDARYFGRWRLR